MSIVHHNIDLHFLLNKQLSWLLMQGHLTILHKMSSLFFFTVLLLTACSLAVADESCQDMAVSGNCNFYSQCVEKRVPCGPNGYALGYGGKYCVKFGEYIDCFTQDVS